MLESSTIERSAKDLQCGRKSFIREKEIEIATIKAGHMLTESLIIYPFRCCLVIKIDSKTKVYIGTEMSYLLIVKRDAIDITHHYPSKFDIGASAGIAYQIYKNFGADIRYVYGFNTVYYVDDAGTRFSEKNGGNRVFQVGLTYDLLN